MMQTQFQKTWIIVTAIILFYALFLVAKLYPDNFNITSLIELGHQFAGQGLTPTPIKESSNSFGYDGQFYYRLALDPLTNKQTAFGITLDQPALRQQRILYPFLTWLLAFGNKALIPWTLVIINILAIISLIISAVKISEDYQTKWLAIILPLYPAFLIAISRDLTEILSSALLLGGYLLYTKNKNWPAIALFSLAALTRETTLIFPTIFALYSFVLFLKNKNRSDWLKVVQFSIPLIIFLIWQTFVYHLWQRGGLSADYNLNITGPFQGWDYLIYFKTLATKIRIFEMLYLLGVVVLGALNFHKAENWPLKITWLSYLTLFTLYSHYTWSEDFNFFRACTELFIFSFILVASGDKQASKKLLFFSTLAIAGLIVIKILVTGHLADTLLLFPYLKH